MKAQFSTVNCTSAHCCAVACSSAPIARLVDTAVILAVSIFICLFNIRLRAI